MINRSIPFRFVTALAFSGTLALAQHKQEEKHADHMNHRFENAAEWAKNFDNPARDAWQMPDKVVAALKLQAGDAVADIGAGTGYFSARLAKANSKVQVYGADIEPSMVEYLRKRAAKEGLANMHGVQAGADSPNLPVPMNLILIVDTYHHIANRVEYFRRLSNSLKPGGRVAIIDFRPEATMGPPKHFRFAASKIVEELSRAGLRQVEAHDFLPQQNFLIFAKAGSSMLVTTDWLAANLTDTNLVILHVAANRAAYDAGHVPGARFLALSDLVIARGGIPNELPGVSELETAFEAVGVSDSSRVILYGDASVLPAARAYFTLDYLGLGDRAALLDGGLEKWRAEGKPLSRDAAAAAKGELTPHVRTELVATMDAVKKIAEDSSEVLLDVRAAPEFAGEKGSHIPGARQAFWMENQASRENQTLQSEDGLRRVYEGLGLTPEKRIVVYCNSGMQASQSYFTLKHLGYKVRLYDGSMSEWKANGGRVESHGNR